ncbi:uncharacterized protein [Euwallacea fornicatus]|uniref:uncharacterized protein n=1 Tax=Euwallacea fornicatus TaxID=995702 RepID=UPI0033902F99
MYTHSSIKYKINKPYLVCCVSPFFFQVWIILLLICCRSVLKAFIKPPERASYIVSTETLASKYQGVSETPSIPNLNTRLIPGIATSQSKPDKAKPVQSSEDVAPINIILSTKSLIPDHTCQPSGTKRDRIIDLTKHDQDNRECLEKCDKMQCPMYKKLFFTQNYMEMDACPRVGFQEESGKGAKIKELVKTASEKKQAKQKRKLVKIPMDSGQLIHEDNASAAEMTSKNDDFYLGSTKQKLEGIGWRECEKILSIDDHDKDNRCRSSKLDYAGLPPRLEKNGDKRSSKPSNVYSCYGNGTEKFQANVCPGLDDSINYRTMNTGRYLCFPHKCSEKPLANILTQGTEFSANQDAKQVGPKCQSCPYISVSEPDIQKSSQKSNARKEEYSKRTTQLPPDIKNFQPNHGKTTATDTTGRNNSKDGIFCWKKSLENSSPARFKRNDVSAQFGHDDDSSAMFRKVFAVNGVGLECQCCISSFTYSKEK